MQNMILKTLWRRMTRKKRKRGKRRCNKGVSENVNQEGPGESETPDASIAHPENGIEKN